MLIERPHVRQGKATGELRVVGRWDIGGARGGGTDVALHMTGPHDPGLDEHPRSDSPGGPSAGTVTT